MLHILRHSPHRDDRLSSCLRVMGPEQSLLLIEDAVYALLPDSRLSASLKLLPGSVRLFALTEDLHARGMALDDLPWRVQLTDHAGVVQLCCEHSRVVSW